MFHNIFRKYELILYKWTKYLKYCRLGWRFWRVMFGLSLTILHIHGATRTHMFAWPLHQNVMLCDTKQGVGDSFYQIYCCCSSQWVRWAVNGGWSMETVLIIHPVSRLTLVTPDADATSGFYAEWRVDFHQDIIDSSCHYKYSSTFWKKNLLLKTWHLGGVLFIFPNQV